MSIDTTMTPPARLPACANFSSGPSTKRPGWSVNSLKTDVLGRSHRSKPGKARLKESLEKTRALLGLPSDYLIGIVPASDTGALEMALWSLLGARPVTALAWESFGQGWVGDIVKELKLTDTTVLTAPYGALPDLGRANSDHDIVFTWNGTTSGVAVPDGDWIRDDRKGLTICDATSAIFAYDLPYNKLDVVTYSWQKVLGGEAAHGVIILSPRAVERLESYTPAWPMPKIFRMTKGGKLIKGIFEGETINTPSMLALADYIDALDWAQSIGGLPALIERSERNRLSIQSWIDSRDWVENLAIAEDSRSRTSLCFRLSDPRVLALDEAGQRAFISSMARHLEQVGAAYDIGGYRDAPPGLRIWCGATVEATDIEALLPWLDWAYKVTLAEQA